MGCGILCDAFRSPTDHFGGYNFIYLFLVQEVIDLGVYLPITDLSGLISTRINDEKIENKRISSSYIDTYYRKPYTGNRQIHINILLYLRPTYLYAYRQYLQTVS